MTRGPSADIVRLLLSAEAKITRAGWDQPAALAVILSVGPKQLALAELDNTLPSPPNEYVQYLGRRSLDLPQLADDLITALEPGHFYGTAFIYESWELPESAPEEFKEMAYSGVHPADIPGVTEVRTIGAIDLWARTYYVARVRGEEPLVYDSETDTEGRYLGGGVLDGLRNITLSVARALAKRNVRDAAEQVDALTYLVVSTVEDEIARDEARRKRQR